MRVLFIYIRRAAHFSPTPVPFKSCAVRAFLRIPHFPPCWAYYGDYIGSIRHTHLHLVTFNMLPLGKPTLSPSDLDDIPKPLTSYETINFWDIPENNFTKNINDLNKLQSYPQIILIFYDYSFDDLLFHN